MHENCTANSPEAAGVKLARGTYPEIFKNHYPDFTDPYAMFETHNVIQKTLLLVRNPLDTFLSQLRHIGADNVTKVGKKHELGRLGKERLEECPEGFSRMRPETRNTAIDPLGICDHDGVVGDKFDTFILQWRDFFSFWFDHSSTQCTDVVAVRYEDLVTHPGRVVDILLEEAGLTKLRSKSTTLAVEKFAPNSERLSYNIYFNEALAQNATVQAWAESAMQTADNWIQQFGYEPLMNRILENLSGTILNGTE